MESELAKLKEALEIVQSFKDKYNNLIKEKCYKYFRAYHKYKYTRPCIGDIFSIDSFELDVDGDIIINCSWYDGADTQRDYCYTDILFDDSITIYAEKYADEQKEKEKLKQVEKQQKAELDTLKQLKEKYPNE